MAKYCDPKILETTWHNWSMAAAAPQLESIRKDRMLWTKIGDPKIGDHCAEHVVASANPFCFKSVNGIVASLDSSAAIKASFGPANPLMEHQLSASNFLREDPIDENWEKLSAMVYKICCGVALNFHLQTEDLKNELVHEAVTHVLLKIRRGKLRFDLGRAPAFNLLTTAIFRIMYSIKNKEKRERNKKSAFVDQILYSSGLPELNSIKVSQNSIYEFIKT